MRVKDLRDAIAGSCLVLLGVGAGIASLDYGIGTPSATEPGFFPMILSVLITLVGLGVLWGAVEMTETGSLREPILFDPWHLWSLAVVAGGFVLFGLLLPVAGLFVTCLISITAVGAGSRLLAPRGAFVTALVLSVVAVVLFRYLLDIQVQAWPWGG